MFRLRKTNARRICRAAIETLEQRMLLSSVVVNTIVDGPHAAGLVSLRNAIAIADRSSTPTTITFDPTVVATQHTITLDGIHLALTKDCTIIGPTDGLTISGDNKTNVMVVDAGAVVTLSNLTIADGYLDFDQALYDHAPASLGDIAAGLTVRGSATLTDVTISGNSIDGDYWGSGKSPSAAAGVVNLGTLTIVSSTISGNINSTIDGGGINNQGTITISNSTISGNTAIDGGGMENSGTATLKKVTVENNYAVFNGGGIDSSGTLVLKNMTVSNNYGSNSNGGLSTSGTTTITNVVFLDDSGEGCGAIGNGGTLTATNVSITGSDGSYGAAINNSGHASFTNLVASNNDAQGLYGAVLNTGTMTCIDATFSDNRDALWGGAIDNAGTLTLVNSTLSGNATCPGGLGGAIYNGQYKGTGNPVATLLDCTISGDTAAQSAPGTQWGSFPFPAHGAGGGIFNAVVGTVHIGNTIIAGNTAAGGGPDVAGTIDSLGHNLIGERNHSTGWVHTDLTGIKASPLNATLGPLANNGGFTQTMLPLAGSPAIGAGSVALIPAGITTDQRGFARILDGTVDIGAVEI